MSNIGGDGGEGDTPLPPETPEDDPLAAYVARDGDNDPPPQEPAAADRNPDNEGTQDASATEQPQQVTDQGAAPVRPESSGSRDAQPRGSNSGRAPSPARSGPATPSRSSFMTKVTGWIGGNRGRRSSSATADSTGNVPQRSNTSLASGSRPISLAEEPEPVAPGIPSPELVGPSRRRLNSQGSGSQGSAGSPTGRGDAGPRATRADTGLSVNTDVADLEAIGENTPTPLGIRTPFGPRSAGGNRGGLPTTAADPLEPTRRNRAFVNLYELLRAREVVVNGPAFQQAYDSAREWRFQLGGPNALDEIANEGVASVRDVVAARAANIPAAIQTQIIAEARRGAQAARDRVNNALVDERNFVENTARDIIALIEAAPASQTRRRGSSRASRAESLRSNASQPELLPMDPRALMRNTREELVDRILAMDRQREDTDNEVARLEDEAEERQQSHAAQVGQAEAVANVRHGEDQRTIQNLQAENDYLREQLGEGGPPRQDPVDQPPARDNSEGSPQSTQSRSRAVSAPRSPQRQQAFNQLETVLRNLARHEALVRQLQENAGLEPGALDGTAVPFSANAQLSRTQFLLQLRDIREERDGIRAERDEIRADRDEIRRNETRLQDRVHALEAAQASPPSRRGTGSIRDWLGLPGERAGAGPATPIRDLADELEAQGSGGSPGPAISQSPGSRTQSVAGSRHSDAGDRQSVAGSRHSNASSNNSANFRTPPEGGPAAVNPAPLRAIPEWLATHPNGPCGDCVAVFRFPPELGELPTCGCTCDLALGNPPPPAGGSPGAASSRSRTGSGRSVRFADDGPAAEGSGGRRPAPLDLSALGIAEENDADRPNTPYPADAEGAQPGAPAPGEQAGSAPTQAPGDGGSAAAAAAPEGQAGTVPIQAPEEEGPEVEEPAVEAPVVVAPAGRRGGRCPCCGRGAYADPPAGGLPQVAFYTCRNMAGQPILPRAEAPMGLLQGLRNALGLVPAEPRPAGPEGRDRGDQNPPAGPEPPANGPDEAFVPGPGEAPRDRVMSWLTVIWTLISFCLFPLVTLRHLLRIIPWLVVVVYNILVKWGLYFNLRYLANLNVARPIPARFPIWEAVYVVLSVLALWFITMFIAVFEERRIWKAANVHLSAAYFRGVEDRRPYPWYAVFLVDAGLLLPAFGSLSKWIHSWYFGQ